MTDFVSDEAGRAITVGTRVYLWDHPFKGTVTAISDFDGDVDDDTGRSITIPPDVTVRFDNGSEGSFRTSGWTFDYYGYDDDYACPTGVDCNGVAEDLIVIRDYNDR